MLAGAKIKDFVFLRIFEQQLPKNMVEKFKFDVLQ